MTNLFTHYRFVAVSIWLMAVASSLAWNTVDNIREKNEIAQETARAFFEQIIASRRWNLMHGGVYVYTTENSPLNLFLPKDKQSIRDEQGRQLTLINPAYMTRQIAAINEEVGLVRFHITSLTPLRAENSPHQWEIPWLESFNRGYKEQGAFTEEDGEQLYRYMAPLVYTKSCAPCHAASGQQPGDIRGAISISIPIRFHKSLWPLILSHLFVAILGIGGIFFFGGRLAQSRRNILATNRKLEREVEERKQTEKKLISIQENLEHIVASRTAELRQTNEILDGKIKEQQKIEASLIAINDEFIQIFNSAPDGMHVIDRNFNVIRVNRAFCQLTGKNINDIQGHKCYNVFSGKLCHTDKCPLIQIVGGTKRVEIEFRKNRADGKRIPCIVTATPFREPGGKLTGIIEVTRDISNWKQIEHSLSATAEHLQARNTELKDFVHVISHDLQEPLMLIQAFSEKLQTKHTSTLPQKGIRYLEQIENSARRMQDLIDGLLLYSRVSSKAKPFDSVRLQDIIDSVLDDLTVNIEKTQASITVDPNMATIEADPLQMRQLFQNIIANSLKYHHQDRKPNITIKRLLFPNRYNNRNYVRISIEDNGIGFKPEYQKQIFDIFHRLHTRQQYQGTGIGLSICKKIIDRHQGTITAKGTPDQGAAFIITLPLQQQKNHLKKGRNSSAIDTIINRR
jgi:PAS domain S-box-containing protein